MAEDTWFRSVPWFEPFGLGGHALRVLVESALSEGRVLDAGAVVNRIPALPIGADEPEALLLEWPMPRSGLIALIAAPSSAQSVLAGLWPFVTEGVQHRLEVDGILLARDRLSAFLTGAAPDGPALPWFDPFFAADRGD